MYKGVGANGIGFANLRYALTMCRGEWYSPLRYHRGYNLSLRLFLMDLGMARIFNHGLNGFRDGTDF
jgi:hypothetical protein